ncbi:MAG: Hpt domain-containing protein, partial [Rhodobacteraceae bacterium]|nr:Hpt domain-containing protein [Paracoccaceae bacterium]
MQMPVMDGPAAMQKIRDVEDRTPRVPIIALTADAVRDHHATYFTAGADAVVTKPVNWAQLIQKIAELTNVAITSPAQENRSEKTHSPPPLTAPILDASFLETIVGSVQPKTLNTLLQRFEQNSREYIEAIRGAADHQDSSGARKVAHTLKGLAAQFGAVRLSECARNVEQAAKNGDNLNGLAEQMAALLPQTLDQLNAWRSRRDTGP